MNEEGNSLLDENGDSVQTTLSFSSVDSTYNDLYENFKQIFEELLLRSLGVPHSMLEIKK